MTRRARVNQDRGESARKVLRKLGYLQEEGALQQDQFVELAGNLIADLLHMAETDKISLEIKGGGMVILQNILQASLQNYYADSVGTY